jgi:ABC-type anion transport system duplicated permease subunit
MITLLVIAVALAAMIIFAIILTRRRRSGLNVEKYRSDWLKIDNSLDNSNPMTYQMAILNADKLLDRALKDIGVPGGTMGDRLKISSSRFSDINQVWTVHKLRNRIAHETDIKINLIVAKKAMYTYKKSLKELGAI